MALKDHDERLGQPVSDQAAEWFIRLRDRDLTTSDRRKFVRWLKHSPSHISEFMRLGNLYGRVKRAKGPTLLPDEVTSNVVPLMQRELAQPEPESEPGLDPELEPELDPELEPESESEQPLRPTIFGSRKLLFAAAACCLLLIGVIANIVVTSNKVETRPGEWRTVQLADGSVVSAGPNTLVQVEYSDAMRRINLQRGEAMFKVKKDESRPFIVNAGGALARAVGTRFGVERRDDRVRVTVEEGTVAVVRAGAGATLEHDVDLRVATALNKDERVEVLLNTPAVPLHTEKVNAREALAWVNGQLILKQDSTVGEAVVEFNRRNRLQIVIDDAEIANGHLCCFFDVGDPEAFAESITGLSDDIELVREGTNILRIVHRRSGPGQAAPPSGNDAP